MTCLTLLPWKLLTPDLSFLILWEKRLQEFLSVLQLDIYLMVSGMRLQYPTSIELSASI